MNGIKCFEKVYYFGNENFIYKFGSFYKKNSNMKIYDE